MIFRWRFLEVVGFETSHEYAQHCVRSLLGRSLLQQLKIRRIQAVKNIIFPRGALGCNAARTAFIIGLDYNKSRCEDYKAITFVHELGHTFHYDIETMEPYPGTDPVIVTADELECVEQFANEFAYLWLSHEHQRYELIDFLDWVNDQAFVDLRLLRPS